MQSYDVVMLVLNDVLHDGRVRREAAALAGAGWRVLVVGTQRADGRLPDRETLQGFALLRVRYRRFGARLWRPWRWIRHGAQAWQIIQTLRRIPTRAYHAHDLPALILLSLARAGRRESAGLVYDSHELYLFKTPYPSRTVEAWHWLTRPAFMRLERYLIRRTDAVITVCEAIARLLATWYDIPRPVVVRNALEPASESSSAPVDLRQVAGGRRCVVHTGRVTNRGRCVTELVEALALLPEDVVLVFLGEAQGEERELVQRAERLNIGERIIFVPPVQPEQVPAVIRSADAAAVLMRPDSFNMRAALPVKFFEAVAAGVPVVTSNRFTLARLVRQHDLGRTCEPTDPASIAAALRDVLAPERQVFYREHVIAARQAINWQAEAAKLCAVYRRVLHE
jgi:glycosyltransferase involved in cell wall biosynthesis